jgi:hypothetical protein
MPPDADDGDDLVWTDASPTGKKHKIHPIVQRLKENGSIDY